MHARSRLLRKKGRAKKLKYSWKSAGHPSMWRRIADGKNQSCKQYIPCECKPMCGKECPCLDNATCCEKYCGYVYLITKTFICIDNSLHSCNDFNISSSI